VPMTWTVQRGPRMAEELEPLELLSHGDELELLSGAIDPRATTSWRIREGEYRARAASAEFGPVFQAVRDTPLEIDSQGRATPAASR
jgi:hypothetical protein